MQSGDGGCPGLSRLLLILSGDVELNPGPTMISVFSLDDVELIHSELLSVAEKWEELGTVLKLKKTFLEKLKKEGEGEGRSPADKLRLVVAEWLNGRCPCPTWGTLIEALRHALVEQTELADQLESKYKEEDENSPTDSEDSPHPYGCGIPNCSCLPIILSTLESTCPSLPYFQPGAPRFRPSDPDFDRHDPHRNMETMVMKRLLEFEEMQLEIYNFIVYAWKSLRIKNLTVDELVVYLGTLDLYQSTRSFTHPPFPLFASRLEAFKAAESIEDIYSYLLHYVSFVNFDLVLDILVGAKGDTLRDRKKIEQYRIKYSQFVTRMTMEYPTLFSLPSKSGFAIVRITLDKELHRMKLYEVEAFRDLLNSTFHVSKYVLKLISLTCENKDELVYTYQIPNFARNYIFPLSDKQLDDLKSDFVKTVTCCGYKGVVPPLDPNDTEDIRVKVKTYLKEKKEREIYLEANEMPRPGLIRRHPNDPPLHAALPEPSPFRVDTEEVYVPSYLINLQQYHLVHGTNYVCFMPHASDRSIFTAMVLCQHAMEVRKYSHPPHIHAMVVASNKPRAIEIMTELNRLIPKVKVFLFTGSEEDSVTTKLCLAEDLVIVCTAGKLWTEMETDVVKYNAISMFIIDDCQNGAHQTLTEAVMHDYIRDKEYRDFKRPTPDIIGITSNPCDLSTVMDLKGMEKHLLRITAGVGSTVHIIYTEDVDSDTYIQLPQLKPQLKPEFVSKRFLYRDVKTDFLSHIEFEMSKLEMIGCFSFPYLRSSKEYGDYIQSQLTMTSGLLEEEGSESTRKASSSANFAGRIHALELLYCYYQALKIGMEFGYQSALAMLKESDTTLPSSSSSSSPLLQTQLHSLKNLTSELEEMLKRKNPIIETIKDVVCKNFDLHNSRGVLFVDTFKEAKFLIENLSKSHFSCRPYAVPRCLVTSFCTNMCSELEKSEVFIEEDMEQGREGLEAFSKGESRLLIIPYALELDKIKLDHIDSEMDFIARMHKYPNVRGFVEMEYALTLIRSHNMRSLPDLQRDFFKFLVEVGLKEQPEGSKFSEMIETASHDVMYGYRTRFSRLNTSRRKKQKQKLPNVESIQLRCKKCKVFACHGLEVYSFFIDGGNHCVVPHRDFASRFTTKLFHSKSKTIKRVNRLKKMFCSNCSSPWGFICYFPTKGVQLPVIKSQHFLFEMSRKYYTVKMWSDALFAIPPVSAFPTFQLHGEAEDSD